MGYFFIHQIYTVPMREMLEQIHLNYIKERYNSFPDMRLYTWKVRKGHARVINVYSGKRRVESHRTDTKRGQELLRLKDEKERCAQILSKLESEWLARYNCPCETVKITHYGNTENKRFFDSLKERQNSMEFKSDIRYRGLPYRSKLESDFARIMDDYGIPYKYEPEILLFDGERKCPDFIIYLPWLDLVILIEIFGRCDDVNYVKKNNGKHLAYIFSGWLPGHNMLSFYYDDKTPYIPEMIMEEIETLALRHYLTITGAA